MYKIVKSFNDKYNKTKYKVGDIVEFTEERASEILKVGKLIEKVVEEVVEETIEVEATEKKKSNRKKK